MRETAEPPESGGASRSTVRRIVLEFAARMPCVSSAGMWHHGGSIYCARVLWCGDENGMAPVFDGELRDIPERMPYLRAGGTAALRRGGVLHLATVVRVPETLPFQRQREFARIQAGKNLLAFVSGGTLEHRLIKLTETAVSPEQSSHRVRTRGRLKNSVAGSCRYLEPLRDWSLPEAGCRFFLFIVEAGVQK